MNNKICHFCVIKDSDVEKRIIKQNILAFAIYDAYPISSGHTLIIPKRHIASFFDATDEERQDLLELVDDMKLQIDGEQNPSGYNIGINDGAAAGQTIPHLHIHLIPRYEGDVEDPRGGIRWLVPEKAKYWD